MKILCLLALLVATPPNKTVAHDSLRAQVTIMTSSNTVLVMDDNYAGGPGHYYIGGVPGTIPFVSSQHEFSIADPALAKAIDNRTAKVVITFRSTTGNNIPASITLDMMMRAPKN
jgi:hypothetical protein